MYRRAAKGANNPPAQAPRYEVAIDKVKALAPATGRVIVAGRNATGFRVQIDHGTVDGVDGRVVTYITHMTRLFVGVGDVVQIGQEVGIVGANPRDGKSGLNHVHFEIWDMSAGERPYPENSIDPVPFMKTWGYKYPDGSIRDPKGGAPKPAEVVAAARAVSEETAAAPLLGVPDDAIAIASGDALDGTIGDL
jgi:murein DD-endopeptidase MepM/ murein hydrolase activator NlpD